MAAHLYVVPDQPSPTVDPAEEIHDALATVLSLRTNPLLPLSAQQYAVVFAEYLETFDRKKATP